ncbi:tail fiber assembly protein [Pseudomonas wadenswilerensis]
MRLYSQTTGNCYLPDVHTVIPEDAIEIPDERYQAVIADPAPGKVRAHDADGLPILIDPPELSADAAEAMERVWRDGALATWQWLRDRHRDEQALERSTTLSDDQFIEFLGYLQALRDWPQSERFPDVGSRPSAPSWIAQQTL